ncbi:hypothetical protein BDV98DRAFT_562911 [Pterulicium gracile]|uniref:Uncharacterized protein n=1 Tax=Pterulicium gracile TaxID=1884261 RepID=A0A5C3QS65_9AGAR|nr:hypothetical protein BDV98DRAFT_562911 [Pterula gracilis]
MRYASSVALAVSIATAVNAQAPNLDVSDQCASAFLGIASEESSDCLNLGALLGAVTSPDQSIVGPFNTWIEEICTTDRCSDDTITEIFNTIARACVNETQTYGVSLDESTQRMTTQLYPSLREALCLKDTEADQYCATEFLNDFQDTIGTLSLNNVGVIVSHIPPPANISCTPCGKALYTVARQKHEDLIPFVSGCGEDFNDGQMPAGIQLTADGQGGEGSEPEGAATALFSRGSTFAGIPAILAMGALLL